MFKEHLEEMIMKCKEIKSFLESKEEIILERKMMLTEILTNLMIEIEEETSEDNKIDLNDIFIIKLIHLKFTIIRKY